jgi:hypothetical protein
MELFDSFSHIVYPLNCFSIDERLPLHRANDLLLTNSIWGVFWKIGF